MKAAFTLAAISTLTSAYHHDFPDDNSFHAHCHLSTTLTGVSCADVKSKADQLIADNVDTDTEYKGQMSINSEGDDWIWSKRLTYNKKYTDDQLFEFTTSGSDCTVAARSKSESMSYLDNGVNFCNMWNLLSRVDGWNGQYQVDDCKTTPSDPTTTCARY